MLMSLRLRRVCIPQTRVNSYVGMPRHGHDEKGGAVDMHRKRTTNTLLPS